MFYNFGWNVSMSERKVKDLINRCILINFVKVIN